MAEIALSNLSKTYPDGTVAVENLSLTVADGEFLVLVGPSGCGKSTVLRCVAGLEMPTSGAITLNGRDVTSLPPQARDLAMVFQTYALYPHMTVYDNLAFGLKMRRTPKEEIDTRVQHAAKLLGISSYLPKFPRDLSGGERQRVALGRAIVRQPQAFLMDEPLSNLDAALRIRMRAELLKLQRKLGATVLYVTHDQTEAMTMGSRVAVLKAGRLQQVAPPQELYERPANRFVAGFIGSPAMNFIAAAVKLGRDAATLAMAGQELPLPPDFLDRRPALQPYAGRVLIVGLRPEHFQAASPDKTEAGRLSLTVTPEVVETLGMVNYVHFTLPDPFIVDHPQVSWIAALDPAAPAAPDKELELAFDPYGLHFFDSETGQAILARTSNQP
jgi:multiple sugar transport system ATP-binding protein